MALRVCKACVPFAWFKKKVEAFEDNFFWNFYLRAFLEGCLDLNIVAFLDLQGEKHSMGAGYSFSFMLSICYFVLLAIIALWMLCRLNRMDLTN